MISRGPSEGSEAGGCEAGRRRSLAVVATALAGAVAVVACGVPTEDTPRRVGAGDMPPALTETTTTAATTTTTVADTADPTVVPSTTTPPPTVPQQEVTLVYVSGDVLQPVTRSLPAPVSPGGAMAALGAGPMPEDPPGLRSVLPRDAVVGVDLTRGQATVDLRAGVLERVLPGDAVYLWGQIVLSLTSLPGVGSVAVTIGGLPFTPQRGDGSLAEVVFKEDYEALLEGAPPTTTTTTTTPTTLPATVPAAPAAAAATPST